MIILASLLALAAAAPIDVVAETGPTAVIQLADLDLGSASGQRLFHRRLASAVEDVCGSYANAPEWSDKDRIGDCRAKAMASANRQLAERVTTIRLAAR